MSVPDCNCGEQDRPDHGPHRKDCAVYSKPKRTGGEWKARRDPCHFDTLSSVRTEDGEWSIAEVGGDIHGEQEANTRFIALAGTVANKLDALGYDGDECLRRLPEIIGWLEEVRPYLTDSQDETPFGEFLASLKPGGAK